MSLSLQSWIPYPKECHFPIQNLPYGVFSVPNKQEEFHIGVAIGEYVLDLHNLVKNKYLDALPIDIQQSLCQPTLNNFMSFSYDTWKLTRKVLQDILSKDSKHPQSSEIQNIENSLSQNILFPLDIIKNHLPVTIGDYTDFYASKNHAYNVGVMFRGPDNALQSNWTWLPVGYHGRASSVVVSGTNLYRPCGQITGPSGAPPATHGPSTKLDFELEMGYFIGGSGNALGEPMNINEAHKAIFGCVLLNDWSARDVQRWEYVPLGPFGSKNFGTTISPWIVTQLALEESQQVMHPRHEKQINPVPLKYLEEPENVLWTPHITLDVYYTINDNSNNDKKEKKLISSSNSKYLYWSPEQMVAHHTVTGCNMRAGDLLGSGTISGTDKQSLGSLLEISWNGKNEIIFNNGEKRSFIEDGDNITLTGYSQCENFCIGFGNCSGTILPPFVKK